MKTGKKILWLLSFVVAMQACSEKKEQAPAAKDVDLLTLTQQQLKGVNVRFVQFEKREIKPVIHANGVIRLLPDAKAEVSSHISGKVEKIFVREGMFVRQGQPLLSISSFDLLELQNEYVAAKSDAEFQQVEYKRQEELNKRKIGVLADFQAAKARYQAAVAKEKSLAQKLELVGIDVNTLRDVAHPDVHKNITIHAPISGYVNKFNEHIGSLIQPETILAEIIDPSRIQANVFVYEKDAELVSEGLPVTISFVQQELKPVTGKILFVSRALDPVSRTLTLHVQLDKIAGDLLLADMNIKAEITGISSAGKQRALPTTAIYDNGDANYIFVAGDVRQPNVAMKKMRVEVLQTDDEYAVVKPFNPLPENSWVADNNVLALEAERKKSE